MEINIITYKTFHARISTKRKFKDSKKFQQRRRYKNIMIVSGRGSYMSYRGHR